MLLGEILVKKYGVDPGDIEKALQFQAKFEGMLGSILINMGILSEETLVSALSDQLNLKTFKDIDINEVDFRQPLPFENVNIPFLLQRRLEKKASRTRTDGRLCLMAKSSAI